MYSSDPIIVKAEVGETLPYVKNELEISVGVRNFFFCKMLTYITFYFLGPIRHTTKSAICHTNRRKFTTHDHKRKRYSTK